MNAPSVFVLDANVFINAARHYYAFDIAPAFWEQLVQLAAKGRIVSIDRVRDELLRGNDELAEWAKKNFHGYFDETVDAAVLEVYRQIMIWAQQQSQFIEAAKADFACADNADAWLAAYAKVKGYIVVTHEKFDPNIRRKIPIPNVCQAFGVSYVDTFEMLRLLGVRLGS
ncbi:MAG: DUF4411 family protein [Phage 5P_2]|nr:MAG: DUF4411 family protein [Phage 5P_2]NPV30475.1 DUF4411 family protein [Bacillota bacterium]